MPVLYRGSARYHRAPRPGGITQSHFGRVGIIFSLWHRPGKIHDFHSISCTGTRAIGLGVKLLHVFRRNEPHDPI